VARAFVFRPGIAQPDNQPDPGSVRLQESLGVEK
jgi:hypothetical protein